jgi:hypothetical protein
MTDKRDAPERLTLARWSRRKLEAGGEVSPAPAAPTAPAAASSPAPAAAVPELPELESLTFDSDFAAFLRPEVDEKLKRAALKQLFRDQRFNVMDGLDVYIDDYTKADPIPPDIVKDLLQRGFSAVASAPNFPEEQAPASGSAAPAVTGPAAEPLPAAAPAPVSSDAEPPPEPTPEEPASSRSS